MLTIRRLNDTIIHALVQEYNKLRATTTILGTFFHKDVSSGPTSGAYTAPTATQLQITSPDAVDTPTGVALANELKTKVLQHLNDAIAHKVADTALATTLAAVAAAVDDASTQTLASAIQTAWNSHNHGMTCHYTADTNDDATVINNAATARTSLTAVKAALNTHIKSAPGGNYINVVNP
jgi:hypothetical protein